MIFLPPPALLPRNNLLTSLLCLPYLPFKKTNMSEWGHYYSFEDTLFLSCLCQNQSFSGLKSHEQTQILFQLAYQDRHLVKWKDPLSVCFCDCRLIISYRLLASCESTGVLNSPAAASWSPWMLRDDRIRKPKLNSHSLSFSGSAAGKLERSLHCSRLCILLL